MSKYKQYAKRDLEALQPHYIKHVDAMTAEGLHSKSDIAAELAWRDLQIAEARDQVNHYKAMLTKESGEVTISRNGYVEQLEQQLDRRAEELNKANRMLDNIAKMARALHDSPLSLQDHLNRFAEQRMAATAETLGGGSNG